MEDLNIKCNNKTEAKFIEKYFSDKGCIFDPDDLSEFNDCKFKTPVVLFNLSDDLSTIYFVDDIEDFDYTSFKVIQANHIIRKEKLKRINR